MPDHPRLIPLLCAALLTAATAFSQPASSSGSQPSAALSNLLSTDYLEARLAAVTNRTDLSEEARSKAQSLYQQANAARMDLKALDAEAERFSTTTQSASIRLSELQTRLAEPREEPTVDVPSNAPVRVLLQKSTETEAALVLAKTEREGLEAEPKRRAERRAKIAAALAEHRRSLDELEGAAATMEGLPEVIQQATRDANLLRAEQLRRQIRNLNLELASYDATGELLQAQQAIARRKESQLQTQLEMVNEALHAARAAESAQAAAEAQAARERAEALQLAVVDSLASTNEVLARHRVEAAEAMKEASADADAMESELKEVRATHDGISERVEAARSAGVAANYAVGLALRQEQSKMPSARRYKERVKTLAEQTAAAYFAQIQVSEERRANSDVAEKLEEVENSLPTDLSDVQRELALEECRRLLEERNRLLDDLTSDYSALVGSLAKLSQVQQALIAETESLQSYVSERVLWMPSSSQLGWKDIKTELRSGTSLLSRELRDTFLPYLRGDLKAHPWYYCLAALILVAMLGGRLPLLKGLAASCPEPGPAGRLGFRPALLALLHTILLALPLPVLFWFVAWRLEGYPEASPFAFLMAPVMVKLGGGVFSVEFFRQLCRKPGMAVSHLHWPVHNAQLIRRVFLLLLILGIPISLVVILLDNAFIEGVSNRLAFILSMLAWMLFGHLLLRSERGLRFREESATDGEERPLRFQSLYHFAAIAIPAILILAAIYGYTYTARQFWIRIADSIELGLYILVAGFLVQHWLTVLRRRLALRATEAKREQVAAAQETDQPTQLSSKAAAVKAEATAADLAKVFSQSRRLWRTCLWIAMLIGLFGIWAELFPALKGLDRIRLWGSDTPLVEQTSPPEGGLALLSPTSSPDSKGEPSADRTESVVVSTGVGPRFVSVGDLLQLVVAVALTIVASRNLPGFVELLILSRVKFTHGEGYAITTVLRYLIILLGSVWALTSIGITWGKVQWLAAAATVGIGFGLQEIFANFVSGLILFFERPVRLGDVVTVGDTTGMVTRIHIRATTIRNWDNLELVLPNKELVTGRVVNWTLSNDVTRFSIKLGLSYQADVRRASQLLMEIAEAHPCLLKDPAPFVTFDEFGESTLTVVLRAHVPIGVRLRTVGELNTVILERFRVEGIEIAYPQSDLHLRSLPSEWGKGKDTESHDAK